MLNGLYYHVQNIAHGIVSTGSLIDEWWMGMYMKGGRNFLIEVISRHLPGGSEYPD
jgi:hypothetical protein